jgi:uncharacterized phage protein (TIGR02216 family)
MNGIDWPALMRAGLLGLRLTPGAFWRLTPLELRIMLGLDPDAPMLTRAGLGELMAAFPDPPRRAASGENRDEGRLPDGGI